MSEAQPIAPPAPTVAAVTPTPSNPPAPVAGQKRTLDVAGAEFNGRKSCKEDPYKSLGRHYSRTIELFVDPYVIIKEGVKRVADIQDGLRQNYTSVCVSSFFLGIITCNNSFL